MKFLNILTVICIVITITIVLLSLKKQNNFKDKSIEDYNLFKNLFTENNELSFEMALKLLNSFNHGVRKIKGDVFKYNRFTINKTVKKEVNNLLLPIICKLNNILQTNYKIDGIESVNKTINLSKTVILYKIEFFIVELEQTQQKKLVTEIYYEIYSQSFHINYIELNNCNFVKQNCYLENIPKNTNDTILFNNQNKKKQIIDIDAIRNIKKFQTNGLYKTKLEQNVFLKKNQSKPQTAKEHNKWILPNNIIENSHLNAWPCKDTEHSWGKFGIMKTKKNTKKCYGDNLATVKRNLVSNFTPDHGVLFRDQGQYNNLFKPSSNQHTIWH